MLFFFHFSTSLDVYAIKILKKETLPILKEVYIALYGIF